MHTPQRGASDSGESATPTTPSTAEALAALVRTPSIRVALGFAALVAIPVVGSIYFLKPAFSYLFPGNATATIVRRMLQVVLMTGCLYLAIRPMMRHDSRIRSAALTRVLVGAAVILYLPEITLNILVTPLLSQTLPGTQLPRTVGELMLIPGVLLLYSLLFRFYEGRQIHELSRTGFSEESVLGFVYGISIPSLTILLLFLAGHYSVLSVNAVPVLIYAVVSMVFVSCSEELFFRGVVYRISESELGTHVAIVISAAVFGLAHIANENISLAGLVSASLGGALLGILFSLTGRLWIPIAFHFGWNISQVFFGSNVSGVSEYGGFLESRIEGPDVMTGGAFGIETSLPLLICLALLTALMYHQVVKRGRVVGPFWSKHRPT